MRTLNDVANAHPLVKKILNDISIGHTHAAEQINYHFKNNFNYTASLSSDFGFKTTEASVRRWRRATMDSLDGSQINTEATESPKGVSTKGTPSEPLEAISEPQMKLLLLDIEMTPIQAYVWGTWNINVSNDMIIHPQSMICFAAKWVDQDEIISYSTLDGTQNMIEALWKLLDEADVVIHYNGKKYDIPHINTAFIQQGFGPPSPYKQIDLLPEVRKIFNFESNKLDYVSKKLGASGKAETGGFKLWLGCMHGNPVDIKKMIEYNKQDIITLDECYWKILPWITGHPSFAAFSGKIICPSCGSAALRKYGYYYTSSSKYPRFVCRDCGAWSRTTKRQSGAEITGVSL